MDELFDEILSDYQLLCDGDEHTRSRKVRQVYAIADRRNTNGRILPRKELQKAINKLRKKIKAGAVLGECKHPKVTTADNGEKFYADNPDRKAIRIDDIEDVDDNGYVWGTHTCLDTDFGNALLDRYLANKPYGISMRYKCRQTPRKIGGVDSILCTDIDAYTFDPVENPAVRDSLDLYELLSDSVLQELETPLEEILPDIKEEFEAPVTELKEVVCDTNTTKGIKPMTPFEKAMARYRKAVAAKDFTEIGKVKDHIRQLFADSDEVTTDQLEQVNAIERLEPAEPKEAPISVNLYRSGDKGFAPDLDALEKVPPFPEKDEKKEAFAAEVAKLEAEKAKLVADAEQAKLTAAAEVAKLEAEKAKLAADAEALEAEKAKLAADAELAKKGLDLSKGAITMPQGYSILNPAQGTSSKSAQELVFDNIMAAVDRYAAKRNKMIDPNSPKRKAFRAANKANFIDPLLKSLQAQGSTNTGLSFAFDADQNKTVEEIEAEIKNAYLSAATSKLALTADDANLAAIGQQPTISLAILMQAFQDLDFLSFVEGIGANVQSGPGETGWFQYGHGRRDNGDGTGSVGAVLRVAVETFGSNFAGLGVAEGGVMTEYHPQLTWQPYAPTWKRMITAITADVQAVSAQGPLNYDAIARAIYHLGFLLSRTIDYLIAQEILTSADEIAPVAVSAETVNLASNSVYSSTGGVTINLNATKTAVTTPVAGTVGTTAPDNFVTYASTVIAAVRVKEAGNGSSSPYACGVTSPTSNVANGVALAPIVRPRTVLDLTAAGQYTTTVNNPIAITAPASQVMGYYDPTTKAIVSYPNTTATYAVDYDNGVFIFNAASGITGTTAGIVSTTITIGTYSYATNGVFFQANTTVYGTSVKQADYYNSLFFSIDNQAAYLSSDPIYMKSNLALMHTKASPYITNAAIFYKWMQPEGTVLFPEELYFFERNGIMGARTNAPYFPSNRIILGRHGLTKYAVSINEIKGPFQKRDSSGNLLDEQQYLCHQLSVIATPLVTLQTGTIQSGYSNIYLW